MTTPRELKSSLLGFLTALAMFSSDSSIAQEPPPAADRNDNQAIDELNKDLQKADLLWDRLQTAEHRNLVEDIYWRWQHYSQQPLTRNDGPLRFHLSRNFYRVDRYRESALLLGGASYRHMHAFPEVYLYLGLSLYQLEKYPEAAEALRAMTNSKDGRDWLTGLKGDATYALGDSLFKLGQFQDASAYFSLIANPRGESELTRRADEMVKKCEAAIKTNQRGLDLRAYYIRQIEETNNLPFIQYRAVHNLTELMEKDVSSGTLNAESVTSIKKALGSHEARRAAISPLARYAVNNEPAVFAKMLLDPDAEVRRAAFFALRGAPYDKTIDTLLPHLPGGFAFFADRMFSSDGQSALDVIHYFSGSKEKRVVDALTKCISSEKGKWKSDAARVLGLIGDASATEPLIQLLQRSALDKGECYESIESLGRLRARQAVPVLCDLFKQTNEWRGTQKYAADALGQIGDPSVIPLLEQVSQHDPKDIVRAAAKDAIAKIKKDVP